MNPYEHFSKEVLKQAVDNNHNYPDWIKAELKAIIEAGRSPEEIVEGVLTFFSTLSLW